MGVGIRGKMKAGLGDRTKESFERKDDSGKFKDYFNRSKMEGIPRFNPGKGTWVIDIIPYEAGSKDPFNKKGDASYVLDILVHLGVGPAEDRIVCPAQYGKPCPICEEIKRLNNDGADYKSTIKPLVAKRRTMYNVIVRENPDEEKKGVQLLEISHFFLEKNIAALVKNPRKGGYIVFSDPDTGKSISFRRTGVGKESTAYDAYQFIDRDNVISDAELEAARCLDDLILLRDYDEIYALFHVSTAPKEEEPEDDEEDVPEPPKKSTRKAPAAKEDEPEDDEEDVPEPPTRKKATRKAPAAVCPVEEGTLGVTLDEFVECDTCDLYDACTSAVEAA